MNKLPKTLLTLLLFNAISAIGGGIALITGAINEPVWIQHTDFSSLYFPGVILAAIVGGSALIAAFAILKNAAGWQLACIVAGTIMLFWIVIEIVSIRGLHPLQVVYLVTGAAIIWYTSKSKTTGSNG